MPSAEAATGENVAVHQIYRPFFLGSAAVMLTAGAAWGAFLLQRIGTAESFFATSIHEVNAHGHAQVMGWLGLFFLGFAYEALPRMWRVALPAPLWAWATWVLMLFGIGARSGAMIFRHSSWAAALQLAGTAAEFLALAICSCQLILAGMRARATLTPAVGFLCVALFFALLQTVFGGWHIAGLIAASNREDLLRQIIVFHASLRNLQIHGMAIFGVLGFFLLMQDGADSNDRRVWTGGALLFAAVLLETVMPPASHLTGSRALMGAMMLPWLLLPLGTTLVIWPAPGRSALAAAPDWLRKFFAAAFVWAFVSYALLLSLPLYRLVSGISFSHAYYGATRHAVAVGFISIMVMGLAAEAVPRWRGISSGAFPGLWLSFGLINLGCLWRVVFQILTDWHTFAFSLIAVSGALEWTALLLWAAHLTAVMLGRGVYCSRACPPSP